MPSNDGLLRAVFVTVELLHVLTIMLGIYMDACMMCRLHGVADDGSLMSKLGCQNRKRMHTVTIIAVFRVFLIEAFWGALGTGAFIGGFAGPQI